MGDSLNISSCGSQMANMMSYDQDKINEIMERSKSENGKIRISGNALLQDIPLEDLGLLKMDSAQSKDGEVQ